jgi:Fur family transcriptional regulator, zinc uptake regulator
LSAIDPCSLSANSPTDAYAQTLLLCKQKGLRMTQLRRRILGLIIHALKPMSAYALVSLYKESGTSITATTVYRTLDFLEENGLIHRLATKNAYVSCITPGHSLNGQFWICQQCHVVLEMHSEAITKTIDACAVSQDFLAQGQVVEVFGLCKACQKK